MNGDSRHYLGGKTHVSQVGVSQMTTLGLPEFVAADEKEYIEIAVRMTSDLKALAEIRRDLRARMASSPHHGCSVVDPEHRTGLSQYVEKIVCRIGEEKTGPFCGH